MDVEATLDRALQLGEEGEWAEMAQLLENALEDDTGNPYLMNLLFGLTFKMFIYLIFI